MENENIVIFRLYGGEMIIGKIKQNDTDTGNFELDDPRCVMLVPSMRGDMHVMLRPVCSPFAIRRLEKSLTVSADQVMFRIEQSEIDNELLNGYKSEISGIKIASVSDTMNITAANQQQGGGEFIL